MARYGFTRTLPTITGSHSDFPVALTNGSFPTAAIDGGASSILNGGGNLRAYTDDTKTTQLPVEIVSFVTGGTPDIQVRVKVPTAATGNTVYIEADTVAIAQPAVTDTYGRNAVWTSRFEYVDHMENTVATDASGQQGAFDSSGEPVTNSVGKLGNHANLSLTEFFRQNFPANTATTGYYLGGWVNLSSLTSKQRLFDMGPSKTYIDTGFASAGLRFVVNNSGASLIDLGSIPSGLNHIVGIYDGTTMELLVNGVVQGSNTVTVTPSTPSHYKINNGGADQRDATYDEVKFGQISTFDSDYVATEYANENDPDNWGTSSAWEDQDAVGGITINMPLIGAEAVVFGLEVVVSPVIEMPLIGSEAIVYNPEVLNPLVIDMPLIGQEASIFVFTVSLPLSISMPLIEGETLVYSPFVVVAGGTSGPVQYERVVYYRGN